MEPLPLNIEAERLANRTITALIDMGYLLTLEESFGIKDRIEELLEEEASLKLGHTVVYRSPKHRE